MADLKVIAEAVIQGNRNCPKTALELTEEALAEGVSPKTIFEDGLMAGMAVVIEKFKKNEVFIPEVLISARAFGPAMDRVKPLLLAAGSKPAGKVVIGTVKGDLHDIGKNLVSLTLKGQGFDIEDLGTDVAADVFVKKAEETGADLIAMSALLTTTMPQMKTVVDAVKEAGCKAKTIIGGAPVTQEYANEIGADGYAPDAATAVEIAKQLVV
ncbi:MAG: corrinoid protein [Phycisphaerae bacterium]|nr:corrinoid protein [Phycisphaerae bacterium]